MDWLARRNCYFFSLVHSPGSPLHSMFWLPGRKLLVLSTVSLLSAYLKNPWGIPEVYILVKSQYVQIAMFMLYFKDNSPSTWRTSAGLSAPLLLVSLSQCRELSGHHAGCPNDWQGKPYLLIPFLDYTQSLVVFPLQL